MTLSHETEVAHGSFKQNSPNRIFFAIELTVVAPDGAAHAEVEIFREECSQVERFRERSSRMETLRKGDSK